MNYLGASTQALSAQRAALPHACRQRTVWLVEDSESDAEAVVHMAHRVQFSAALCWFRDGVEMLDAMAQMERAQVPFARSFPTLILLDLNLPNPDGRTILKTLKHAPVWQSVPTLVLTTSDHPQDIVKSYHAGANAFLQKPMDLEPLGDALRAIDHFWLQWALVPSA